VNAGRFTVVEFMAGTFVGGLAIIVFIVLYYGGDD
jgi:hypothetical protein